MFNSNRFPIVLAIVALPLLACDKASEAHAAEASEDQHEALQSGKGTRVVAVDVGDQGFNPSNIAVKKGQATTLKFTRSSDKTCATKVVFPEISVEKALPLNQPVSVVVPTDKSRTLVFQCGMGMYKSSVVIN